MQGLVVCESELVVIMGKRAKNVSEDDALDYVFGYTAGNDVSARDWQGGPDADTQWWRAKSADTFGPTGPFMVTDIDPQDVNIRGLVNGVEGQKCHSSEMIFNVAQSIRLHQPLRNPRMWRYAVDRYFRHNSRQSMSEATLQSKSTRSAYCTTRSRPRS